MCNACLKRLQWDARRKRQRVEQAACTYITSPNADFAEFERSEQPVPRAPCTCGAPPRPCRSTVVLAIRHALPTLCTPSCSSVLYFHLLPCPVQARAAAYLQDLGLPRLCAVHGEQLPPGTVVQWVDMLSAQGELELRVRKYRHAQVWHTLEPDLDDDKKLPLLVGVVSTAPCLLGNRVRLSARAVRRPACLSSGRAGLNNLLSGVGCWYSRRGRRSTCACPARRPLACLPVCVCRTLNHWFVTACPCARAPRHRFAAIVVSGRAPVFVHGEYSLGQMLYASVRPESPHSRLSRHAQGDKRRVMTSSGQLQISKFKNIAPSRTTSTPS